jgi:isopentenyldiphosphate isomerase
MNRHIIIPAVAGDGSLYPVEKMDAHVRGLLHLAVSVFVFDGDELLIQRRAGEISLWRSMGEHLLQPSALGRKPGSLRRAPA